jgi:hypothetical protein
MWGDPGALAQRLDRDRQEPMQNVIGQHLHHPIWGRKKTAKQSDTSLAGQDTASQVQRAESNSIAG